VGGGVPAGESRMSSFCQFTRGGTDMRRFLKFTFGVAILAAWAAPVQSATKLIPEEGTVEIMLLRQKSVRTELKLSDSDAEKVHKYAAQQWKKAQEVSE